MMGDGPRPAVKRRRLRAELRHARQEADLTQDEVAEAMDWSPSKIIRIEAGSVGVSTNDMRALLRLYNITEPDRTEELLELAREARERSTAFKGVPPTLRHFIEYEAAASAIRGFEPLLIPGLLQTEEYTRAVLQRLFAEKPRAEVDAMIKVRMKRQDALNRPELKLLFVLDEAALRRQVGGATTMRRQVCHLAEMARKPNVTLEVVPFSAGAHPGMQGPFVIFEFPDAEDDDVLYLESSRGDLIIKDEPDEISEHKERLGKLQKLSLGRKGSQDFLDDLAAQANGEAAAR